MKQKFRMLDWLLFAIALSVFIFVLSPQQLPVSLYKLNLIAIAGVVGYWLDRSLFPYARPDRYVGTNAEPESADTPLHYSIDTFIENDLLLAATMIRRAIIVASAMIAVGLGA